LLSKFGVATVYHYAPLHYLPFIARRGALLSKTTLRQLGFADSHFRSTSRAQDEARGFARYVHLTLDAHPPILSAKLSSGFPHFEVALSGVDFNGIDYLLCRFNIAKTRYFRGAKQAPLESEKNGRYHSDLRLPVAVTLAQREALLRLNLGENMIEVLVPDQMPINERTVLRFFHDEDLTCAGEVLQRLGIKTYETARDLAIEYKPSLKYRDAVKAALARSIVDPSWRGAGLEFDRV
jgi:hypothetical protein